MPSRPPIHRPARAEATRAARRAEYDRGRDKGHGFYSTARWRRFRKWYLAGHPLCVDCSGVASEVDHVLPLRQRPDLSLDPENMRALCKSCHSRRTRQAERGDPGGGRALLEVATAHRPPRHASFFTGFDVLPPADGNPSVGLEGEAVASACPPHAAAVGAEEAYKGTPEVTARGKR